MVNMYSNCRKTCQICLFGLCNLVTAVIQSRSKREKEPGKIAFWLNGGTVITRGSQCCVTASLGIRHCVPFPVINPGPVFLVLSSLLSAITRLLEENALCGAYRDDNVGS